jgi:hypothetical protein
LTAVASGGIIEISMRTADAIRALLSVVLTWAIVWMPAAPPLHAHAAGIEGRRASLVHAHQQGVAPRAHDARFCDAAAVEGDHGDHARAAFLDAPFERASNRWVPAVALPAVLQLLECRTVRSVAPETAARAHAPPLRVWVTRGPPSLS